MAFIWNEEKAKSNLQKHGVSFDEAASVFTDPFSAVVADPLHSEDEDRFVLLGLSNSGRLFGGHSHRSRGRYPSHQRPPR